MYKNKHKQPMSSDRNGTSSFQKLEGGGGKVMVLNPLGAYLSKKNEERQNGSSRMSGVV